SSLEGGNDGSTLGSAVDLAQDSALFLGGWQPGDRPTRSRLSFARLVPANSGRVCLLASLVEAGHVLARAAVAVAMLPGLDLDFGAQRHFGEHVELLQHLRAKIVDVRDAHAHYAREGQCAGLLGRRPRTTGYGVTKRAGEIAPLVSAQGSYRVAC